MKKTLLSGAIIASNFVFSQITLEKTYTSESLQVYTNTTETNYYSVGQNLTTIKIYNANHTLKKQFSPTIPTGYSMNISSYNNFILSKNIFNTDNLLEIVVVFNKYDNGSINKIVIFNEDGQIVKDFGENYRFDDEFDFHVYHDNTTNSNKLRLYKTTTNSTEIYNLPTTSLAAKEVQSQGKLSAFPIPTNKILNIINPDNGANKVQIYDASGKLVMNKTFSSNENKISIDVEALTKGIYIYKIGELSSKFIKN
ncbi:hypothetical protein A0O34_16785 [Chryseobacterium glaciei]|uniref:Secretion system C-terminal sorting domain-containing protein n=1 Tax=Chryseobacterium glaciei TaxID=1685010 RepID=A0A172XR56_9FLAO|nr:T9SS type A sorting domain-containing protein [Chryseobacterium glaciei]ANF49312.1 hypothetical protein A0O34_01520 [Chryseobacterium glaciei]ANF52069.1 hypothetical protein A0O34_16785 [Chryseobacterium glaciei]